MANYATASEPIVADAARRPDPDPHEHQPLAEPTPAPELAPEAFGASADAMPIELLLDRDDYRLLEDARKEMRVARTETEAVQLSLKFVGWILSLQKQGYKLALVKGDHVEPLRVSH